jgi:hypothetical protein
MKFYECRFAPNATTRRNVVRVAQLVHSNGQEIYEAFSPDAFAGWGQREIKILLDHDPTQVAGKVTAIVPHGDWWHASFMLDGPCAARAADWIERSGKVSPGFDPDEIDPDFARPITAAHYPTHWHTRARLREVSLLPPGAIAWYAGAKVTGVSELKATPTPTSHAAPVNRQVSEEVSRATEARIVAAQQAARERQHAEHLMQNGILYRPAIGQVLDVR